MGIYVTGDLHANLDRFNESTMPGEATWTDKDVLIITGDFNFVFHGEDHYPLEKWKLNELAKKPYQIAWIDGNHEGFDYLPNYPEGLRYGAPVHIIRPNIFHLQRGYVYTIQNRRVFTFGGAASTDKAYRLDYEKIFGEKIWFSQELPCREEYLRGLTTLKEHNYQVDYILSHTAPRTFLSQFRKGILDAPDRQLTEYLEHIYNMVTFRNWFFGHFHEDRQLNTQMIACYKNVHHLK